MKLGIVVPYSWSFWGAVVEHAELQARALQELGVETRTIIGNDPPGSFTRLLHPRLGRHGHPPPDVIPVGRSVIVPGNSSLPNLVLSPAAVPRLRDVLAREQFDVLHVHEPMVPVLAAGALVYAGQTPVVATFHASVDTPWLALGMPLWGFLLDRIDYRIAVSEQARASASAYFPGDYDVVPNGVLIPPEARADGRQHQVVFAGRHEPRKGLHVILRAWPSVHERTGARLRVIGADPLAVGLLLSRLGVSDEGIDILGFLGQEDFTAELLSAKALVAPSLRGESFGMVLTRAFACATPAVASDIPGYQEVMTEDTGVLCPPGDPAALGEAVIGLLEDEPRRSSLGAAARAHAQERYAWEDIAARLAGIYELVAGRRPTSAVASVRR